MEQSQDKKGLKTVKNIVEIPKEWNYQRCI